MARLDDSILNHIELHGMQPNVEFKPFHTILVGGPKNGHEILLQNPAPPFYKVHCYDPKDDFDFDDRPQRDRPMFKEEVYQRRQFVIDAYFHESITEEKFADLIKNLLANTIDIIQAGT